MTSSTLRLVSVNCPVSGIALTRRRGRSFEVLRRTDATSKRSRDDDDDEGFVVWDEARAAGPKAIATPASMSHVARRMPAMARSLAFLMVAVVAADRFALSTER